MHIWNRSRRRTGIRRHVSFAGGGVVDQHFAPSFIDQMLLRSSSNGYTPYQPQKLAQGTLQAIFEFQTMVRQLTGMDLANASTYDGSTAMAEAAMASRLTRRDKIAVVADGPPLLPGCACDVCLNLGIEIIEARVRPGRGHRSGALDRAADGRPPLVLQYPNFFGVIEDPRCSWLRRARPAH